MLESVLREDTGGFVYADGIGQLRRRIRVFFACPPPNVREAPIIIAMHGVNRAAAEFRDSMAVQSTRNGQIVLVPEFDTGQFPDVHAYHFGGVRLPPPGNTVLPRKRWNFGLLDRLFEHVRDAIASSRSSFGLFGNSAGAQYVLRYLALTEAPAVDTAVAANCGAYMLPDLTAAYPIGMGGLDLNEGHLRRYLGRRLVILLGDADNDPSAPDLPRWQEAMAQGPHRLARGLWHFEHCAKLAESLGVSFGWRLKIVHGAGHVDQQIYDRGADILKDWN
ncbi:MAG: hypothetical protein J0I57_18450 [Hyphomicrobium sp.]|nr:hypothetical protein [Hyphomicrobium sp.]MBN9279591.1 hypothetical protein [Hyphomicrobium sp.]